MGKWDIPRRSAAFSRKAAELEKQAEREERSGSAEDAAILRATAKTWTDLAAKHLTDD